MDFWIDLETRSVLDLEEVGTDNYVKHPSTQVILASYAWGDFTPKLWQPHLNPDIPQDILDAFSDPFVTAYAWNSSFDRNACRHVLGLTKPVEEWRDPMCNARYLSLPGKLEDAGPLLGLPPSMAKLDGDRLIDLFCLPEDPGGEETLFGISQPTFRDWNTDPVDWELFCQYAKRDIIAMRAAWHKMHRFRLPEHEWQTWFLDQEINARGWPVDQLLVNNARQIALESREPLMHRMKEITGLENPNSRNKLLDWLRPQGYLFDSLGKDFVTRALGGDCSLTDAGREVLELRMKTAKSSISKYTKVADLTGPDGWLRHQYTYYGTHTGRWASHGANLGNLFKPDKEVEKKLDRAVELVRLMDIDSIIKEFSSPLEVAASVQRSAFRAPEGYKFVVCDLNAIENRGLGYLSHCDEILKVFRDGKDPYLSFAVQMFGQSYEELLAEFEAGDKSKRTICKAPVLGGGYQLGPGKEEHDRYTGMVYYTGLMGYARKMGIEMTHEQCVLAIQTLRKTWKEVKWLWKDMERAAAFSIRHPGEVVGVGVPQTNWEEEQFEKLGRKVYEPIVSFRCHGKKILEMILSSDRSLFYWDPRVEVQKKEWEGREYEQDVVYYKARDQKTKQWVETDTFGGHWVENADQAICRDVLVQGMHLANEAGFTIVGSTYDELITLVPLNSSLGVDQLAACMSKPMSWAGDALPLAAAGFEDVIYRKDA